MSEEKETGYDRGLAGRILQDAKPHENSDAMRPQREAAARELLTTFVGLAKAHGYLTGVDGREVTIDWPLSAPHVDVRLQATHEGIAIAAQGPTLHLARLPLRYESGGGNEEGLWFGLHGAVREDGLVLVARMVVEAMKACTPAPLTT